MRRLSGIFFTLLLGLLATTGCTEGVNVGPEEMVLAPVFSVVPLEGPEVRVKLLAGQSKHVGWVDVRNVDDQVYVKYSVLEGFGYGLSETHLFVGDDFSKIPLTPGGPIPGHFPYKKHHTPPVEEFEYGPFTYPTDTKLYVAAHAVVAGAGRIKCEKLLEELPATAEVCVNKPPSNRLTFDPADQFYFPKVEIKNGGILDGTSGAWCTDWNLLIGLQCYLGAQVRLLDSPEVDWILNQDLIGKDYGNAAVVTYGDVQRAMWVLLTGVNPGPGHFTGLVTLENIEKIVELAKAQSAFVPTCGQYYGVVFDPGNNVQPIFIPRKVLCECTPGDDTAWAEGVRFVQRGNWAMYFAYLVK